MSLEREKVKLYKCFAFSLFQKNKKVREQMKVIKEKIVVEQVVNTYIANDGKKFDTEQDCLKYEEKVKKLL